MECTCESECDAALVADLSNLFRFQIERQSQRLEAIGSAALGRGCTIAVLHDFHSGCGSHHRAHGRQIHRRGAVSTGTDDIGGLTVDIKFDGMGDHGLGRSTHLIRSQAKLLLGCQNRTDGRRISVAVHKVIGEPLGFLGTQMVPSDQLGEDRLPCDFSHDALLDASACHVVDTISPPL